MKHTNIKDYYLKQILSCKKYDELIYITSTILNSNKKELNNLEIEKKILNKASEFQKENEVIIDALALNIKY